MEIDLSSKNNKFIYNALNLMKRKCYVKEADGFSKFGAKGIKVQQSWLDDSKVFVKWTLEQGITSDRIHNEHLRIQRKDEDKDFTEDNAIYEAKLNKELTSSLRYSMHKRMKGSVNNKNDHAYKEIGAKGIKYTKKWERFTPFNNWLIEQGIIDDSKFIGLNHLVLDRIDKEGDFTEENTILVNNKWHGFAGTRIYKIYRGMISRCYEKGNTSYPRYGGRGITVCDEWRKDVRNFVKWVEGQGVTEDMIGVRADQVSLDRINNNKNYSPENCKFSSQKVQTRNTRLIFANNTSSLRGVTLSKETGRYNTRITINDKNVDLGYSNNRLEAAKLYNDYVIKNKLEHTLNPIDNVKKLVIDKPRELFTLKRDTYDKKKMFVYDYYHSALLSKLMNELPYKHILKEYVKTIDINKLKEAMKKIREEHKLGDNYIVVDECIYDRLVLLILPPLNTI